MKRYHHFLYRNKHRKAVCPRILTFILAFIILLGIIPAGEVSAAATATAGDASRVNGFPAITSTSAIVMDAESGQIIYEKNSHV